LKNILTFEESERRKKDKPIIAAPVVEKIEHNDSKSGETVKTPRKADNLSKLVYSYFYPDNETNNYSNGLYRVKDEEGKIITLEIKSGVVKTFSRFISNELKKAGFVFMYSREE
jgi:hypothetical protein